MAFYKESSSDNFKVIYNEVLQHPTLSLEAIGLLVFMLSLPENWEYHKSWLMKEKRIGEYKLKKILKELTEAGYLVLKHKQDEKGKMAGHDWIVKEKAHKKLVKASKIKTSTEGVKIRPSANSTVEKTRPTNNKDKKNTKSKSVNNTRVTQKISIKPKSESFESDVMGQLEKATGGKLTNSKRHYAKLKIQEYRDRFPESESIADCWAYVTQAINHQYSLTGI